MKPAGIEREGDRIIIKWPGDYKIVYYEGGCTVFRIIPPNKPEYGITAKWKGEGA